MDDQRQATTGNAAEPGESEAATLVALFDETIDAERALVALQKASLEPEHVSVIVQSTEEGERPADQALAVARTLAAVALETVGSWLRGLASLLVPERGAYLVAGPMGAALTAFGLPQGDLRDPDVVRLEPLRSQVESNLLLRVLADFGFALDEATYLEQRLNAGATLVAVTERGRERMQETRRLFADHDAVYLGLARTDLRFFHDAESLLADPPPVAAEGQVVVADAVAPLRSAAEGDVPPSVAALLRRDVLDRTRADVGVADDVLYEILDPDGPAGPAPIRPVVRYLVVGFGGVLGVGRARVAVPAALADLDEAVIAVAADKETIQRAPAYARELFSRRDEQAVYAYFGLPPHWEAAPPAGHGG